MGYALECYALEHASLRQLIGSGREDVVRTVLEAELTLFDANPGVPWRGALRDLVLGERGAQLAREAGVAGDTGNAGQPAVQASDSEAIAMVALVRAHGQRMGELIHNTRAGEKFRVMFSPDFAPRQFAEPALAGRLLNTSFCGLAHDGYPSWGGLRHADLIRLCGEPDLRPALSPDPDHQEWLYSLHEILGDIIALKTDLVTLYL